MAVFSQQIYIQTINYLGFFPQSINLFPSMECHLLHTILYIEQTETSKIIGVIGIIISNPHPRLYPPTPYIAPEGGRC
jgi:hypothetical protein